VYNFIVTLDENDIETKLTERFARHARDFDDLQNEMAGRDVGRISRFLGADAKEAKGYEKREARKDAALSALQAMMLENPAYAALFEETQTALSDAQTRLDALLEKVQAQIEQTRNSIDDNLDRAASLPDGTKVFKDVKGDVRTQDGAVVAAELAATIIWYGDEPSYEGFQADNERLERLNAIESDIRSGQAEIGDMQAAMEDESHAETSDELEGFKERMDEIEESVNSNFDDILASAPTPSVASSGSVLSSSSPEIPKF
jgi:multidrug efflux pump subunit AcrA (membrane-fusion protein)